MTYVLQTHQLSKRYGKVQALQNLGLSIPRGSIFGILGPNGSGKTTTLAIILGILRANQGHYEWFGEKPHARQQRRIGTLLETPNFYPYLNAEQNLNIVADIKGRGHDRVAHVLKQVSLYERRKDAMAKYSLGMKQRLALAGALLADPEVLVLDEPTNGLDPQGIADVRQIIREVGQDKTIIMASHILDEVEKTCTHLAIMKKGQKLTEGAISEVLDEQLQIEVAAEPLSDAIALFKTHPLSPEIQILEQSLLLTFADNITTTELNRFAFEHNVCLSQLTPQKRNLESFFLELIAEEQR